MIKIFLYACTVMASLLLVSIIGLSQDDGVRSGACKADVAKFCKDIKPGGGRIWACLKSNENSLSQPCRDRMATAREKGRELHQACKDDVKKFCKGIPHGKGRIRSCLKSHENELAPACKAAVQKK
jgi:hypothetical protein